MRISNNYWIIGFSILGVLNLILAFYQRLFLSQHLEGLWSLVLGVSMVIMAEIIGLKKGEK